MHWLKLDGLAVPADGAQIKPHTKTDGLVGEMSGFMTRPLAKEDPRAVAVRFLRENPDLLVADYRPGASKREEPAVLYPARVKRSPIGYHVLVQQAYEGVPVYGGRTALHMTPRRSVYLVTNDVCPEKPVVDLGKARREEIPVEAALESLTQRLPWQGRLLIPPTSRRVFYPSQDGGMRLSWCIDLSLAPCLPIQSREDASTDWRAIVDAFTGEVLDLMELSMDAVGEGSVFYPNPVVALQQPDLDGAAEIPEAAYRTVRLARLDGSGYLRGAYVDTGGTERRVHSAEGHFHFRRGEQGLLEVMAYYFIDSTMAWLREQGWDIFSRPVTVNACAPLGDNSRLLPHGWTILFGRGPVMDAEDASIILHELGHAIQEAQVKDWAACRPGCPVRAMGEGFCDWLPTIFFAEERRTFHRTYIGDWDARGYREPRAYLRRIDSPKTMADYQGEEHADGEIWGAALWDLYRELGGDSDNPKQRQQARALALRLVLTGHQFLADGQRDTLTFAHGLQALLHADRFTQTDIAAPGPHDWLIRDVFAARGIVAD